LTTALSRRFVPSGIEMIASIPEDWTISKISRMAAPGYNTFIDGDWIESPFITAVGVRLIQTGNVGIGQYKEQGFRYISEASFQA